MTALDALNARYSRGTLRLAAQGHKARWDMRQEMKSPRYTTRWDELPVVKI